MWVTPDEKRHPAVWYTKKLLAELLPVVYVDFHGHSRRNGTFAYGCPPMNGAGSEEKLLPKMVGIITNLFSFGKCSFSMPQSRLTASRGVARLEMGIGHSYTIESSFAGVTNGRLASFLYDESSWKELGASIAEGIYHLLTPNGSRVRNQAERELKSSANRASVLLAPLPTPESESEKSPANSRVFVSRPTLIIPSGSSPPSLVLLKPHNTGKFVPLPCLT
jgi:hypothetical protein